VSWIDRTICSFPCKFWHRLSTVAVELLPVSADLYAARANAVGANFAEYH
jgi:hypothetical protein